MAWHAQIETGPVAPPWAARPRQRSAGIPTFTDLDEKLWAVQSELLHASRRSAIATMATTLAHELSQPLAAIQNYTVGGRRLIEKGGDCGALLDGALKSIGENARRAGEVIRRLRDMTGGGEARKEEFDLEQAVREAAQLATTGACAGMVVTFEIAPGARASADRIQVQQVFLNLIRNACEAGSGGPHPAVTISTAVRGEFLEVCVRDTGSGVPPTSMASLFDPVFSTKRDGMGVGLSISRTIVESHGGRIWAENHPGGGASFCFTVPKA